MPVKDFRKATCKNGHQRTANSVYRNGRCKTCAVEQQAKRYSFRQETDSGYRNNRANQDLRYRTGWTLDNKEAAIKAQRGLCGICKNPMLKPCADHVTGSNPPIPRGILCSTCNWAIGLFYENPETCESAAKYLRFHKNREQRAGS